MSNKKDVVQAPIVNVEVYEKKDFVNAKFIYSGFQRDIFAVKMEDGKKYTKAEAEKIISDFLKGDSN